MPADVVVLWQEAAEGKVGRCPLICVLGVPNHMTYADFCRFCGSFIHHILEMRVVREIGSRYEWNFDDNVQSLIPLLMYFKVDRFFVPG
ncbi:BRAP2 RING ZnF UBP domain-containing protein 2-like isoform X3 [Helianthus annuus]|nr:BRAP2 RING ZnF UBP domain-containing protein 2-like isoform X3 [Helianthus annuus]XP_022023324.1 BRAP2 RING ZnF UBP domain-containing protein 2-like isoform X3 [Helianthus annuus]